MAENTRESLNQLYRPLDEKLHELIAKLTKLHGGFTVTSGFYNGHYHKNVDGLYQADAYPIPVISVMGLCDIQIRSTENLDGRWSASTPIKVSPEQASKSAMTSTG